MKLFQILPFFILLVMFSACKQEGPIIGQWKLEKMEMADGTTMFPNIMGNPLYTFNTDNTYEHIVSGQKEKGKYKIEGDELVIKFNESGKVTEMKILELTLDKFVYEIGEETVTKVYLKK